MPLSDIKVLDFSNLLPGPFCSLILADFGAEVIKIERKGVGDFTRNSPRLFNALNRNKKSIEIDFNNNEDIIFIHEFIKECDVLLEGFRPGVMKKAGLDYVTLSEINQNLIYCSISGFGQTGPLSKVPGHDINYLALAGALSISGDPDGPPNPWGGVQIADLSSAMYAVVSILTALHHRNKTKKGDYIDVSITNSVLGWMTARIASYYEKGEPTKKEFLSTGAYGAFLTKDDKYISIGSIEDHFFENLCKGLNRTDLLENERYATWPLRSQHADTLNKEISVEIRKRSSDEWLEIFAELDVPAIQVMSIPELTEIETFKEQNLFSIYGSVEKGEYFVKYPVKFNNIQPIDPKLSPNLGEHNGIYKKI